MIVVALELSTVQAGIAAFCGGQLVASESWMEAGHHDAPLYQAIDRLFRRLGHHPSDVELWAVGRGPGRYSGLRTAITLARFMAMPGRRPVYALNSALPLAAEAMAFTGASRVAVIGDARRGRYWVGVFAAADPAPVMEGDWGLWEFGALAAAIPPDAWCVSAEFDRLRARGVVEAVGAGRWWEGDHFPSAERLGALVLNRWEAGAPSEPVEPLYLHPPVAEPGPSRGVSALRHGDGGGSDGAA